MQLSFNGLESLKEHEGFKNKAYLDTGGVWTIGYGTTKCSGLPVEAGQTCTDKEALQWLTEDSAWAQTAVNQLVKVPLNQNMFDSLVSFIYNVGTGAFRDSTMLKLLNNRDYRGAANQFTRWVFDNGKEVPGLVSRRLMEQALFTQQ